jgi:hypothetical protein
MLKNRLLLAVPLLLGSLGLAACDENGATGLAEGEARVSLLLTDAPSDLEAAVVTITDVYLQGEGAENGGRVYLRQGDPITTDLLTLQNDVIELVDDYEIPAGTYSQLRFVITGAYLEVADDNGGTTIYATSPDYQGLPAGVEADGELKCPSCAQSGFKVLLGHLNGDDAEEDDGEVVFDGEEVILVDFDVASSFGHEAGKSGKWIMRPTLKATRLLTASTLSVRLALDDSLELPLIDSVPLSLTTFSAQLTPAAGGDAKTATFADADEDGVYEVSFGYLFPGEYSVDLAGLTGLTFLTDVALPVTVTLEEGEDETLDLTLVEALLEAAEEAAAATE